MNDPYVNKRCPRCGSEHIDRDEVDIGVGVQYGPYGCYECGWTEGVTYTPPLDDDNPEVNG